MLEPTIGIEIHVELKSQTKVFSNSLNNFDSLPNENISLIDLAYPGTLPKLNKKVVEMALKAALALNCSINKEMHFDRKNYFYPDLPKGYQITQNRTPIGYDGYLMINLSGEPKKIDIERIHIEEDTAKSIHGQGGTVLDFNRAGVPLIEIVTKPVIKSDLEAIAYLEGIREILLYLGISDVKIEEGSMRCDANISLSEKDSSKLGTKAEVKNIGSISNVGTSILYEIERQKKIIESGNKVINETRRFDDKTGSTISMRVKETASDYRYFPEPNIPSLELSDEYILEVKNSIPILPSVLRDKYNKLGINQNNIKTIIGNYSLCQFFESVVGLVNPVTAANILTGEVLNYLNKTKLDIKNIKLTNDNFKELIETYEKGTISSKHIKDIIPILLEKGGSVSSIIEDLGLKQINNDDLILKVINNIIENNPESVTDYRNGQDRALKYLMGQIMKETKGQVNPAKASELLTGELAKL
ncbi:MAG: Asp-tRNA(Asn)/Glu-tRNA(Gln) amidotransferase subunit GatB [Bacilli bacterium]|nr:Asp-tRNA(Asn)/Glu-tRNA(Gln) amidotransferase subunit GatB [Bacilli bacterium]MDD4282566.1 Asp-tRNA(Asn)/Glu-tRNA(Gln) amidotransferase subunit GatB [Bacilli bacterium]MDD4718961.1 Asp-tRNA(Asn)/Glu-tRNA(Gln) amidotransferase subunit GatB [Bacilli bacterium]